MISTIVNKDFEYGNPVRLTVFGESKKEINDKLKLIFIALVIKKYK